MIRSPSRTERAEKWRLKLMVPNTGCNAVMTWGGIRWLMQAHGIPTVRFWNKQVLDYPLNVAARGAGGAWAMIPVFCALPVPPLNKLSACDS